MKKLKVTLMLIYITSAYVNGQTIDCEKKYTQKELNKIEYKLDNIELTKKLGGEIIFNEKPNEIIHDANSQSKVKFETGQNIYMNVFLKKPIISYLLSNGELNCLNNSFSKVTILFKINNGNPKVFTGAAPISYVSDNGTYTTTFKIPFVDYSTKTSRNLYLPEVIRPLNNLSSGEYKITVEIYGGEHIAKTEKPLATGAFTYIKTSLNNKNTGINFSDIEEDNSNNLELKTKFLSILNKKQSTNEITQKRTFLAVKFTNDWEYSKNNYGNLTDRLREVKVLFKDAQNNYYCYTYLWKQNAISESKFVEEGNISILMEEKCNEE